MAAWLRSGFWALVILVILVILVSPSSQSSLERQLSVQLNPGWPSPPPPGGDLLHVRALGDNDTLHYLFCSQGAPTLLLVHTNSSSSTVQVDWPLFLARNTSGSLRVEPESSVLSSTAVVFSRLLEYDDVNDTAVTSDLFPPYELQDFTWSRLNLTGAAARLCGAVTNASSGVLCLQLSVFESDGRGPTWPRLLHTANSSQLEVWIDGLLPRATRSRFLLELQAVGGAYPLSRVEVHRSIDDEYTPSIFKASHWVSAANGSSDGRSFVQWKPVAYRRSDPALEEATPCSHSEPRPQSAATTAAASGLVRAFYADLDPFGLNVTFGLAGEPFYNSTRFLSWTLLVGVGSPPVDSFSPLVVAIMAVGLGSLVLLLLLGGLWVCLGKKAAASTTAYEPIN